MNLPLISRPKPQTLKDRAELVAKAAGETAKTARDTAASIAREASSQVESSRNRALAVAGGAAGIAAGVVFWRSRRDDDSPSVHADPAQKQRPIIQRSGTGAPKAPGEQKPPEAHASSKAGAAAKPADNAATNAAGAAGTRSK